MWPRFNRVCLPQTAGRRAIQDGLSAGNVLASRRREYASCRCQCSHTVRVSSIGICFFPSFLSAHCSVGEQTRAQFGRPLRPLYTALLATAAATTTTTKRQPASSQCAIDKNRAMAGERAGGRAFQEAGRVYDAYRLGICPRLQSERRPLSTAGRPPSCLWCRRGR